MKVFENIRKWKEEIFATAHADSSEYWKFEDELKRIIKELIPIRGNKALTRHYYENTLRYTTHANEHYRLMKERELNGIKVDSFEYQPIQGECILPEEMLHSALLQVIRDDKYSFGHLYWLLGTEYNRQAGFACYDDVVIPEEIIDYAIKFDFDETKEKGEAIQDLNERKAYYYLQKTESALILNEKNDPRLAALKTSYESRLNILCDFVDRQLQDAAKRVKAPTMSTTQKCINSTESIERQERLLKIDLDDYVVAYDFDNCPYNVEREPFNIDLSTYHITKTVNGFKDNDAILVDLMHNLFDGLISSDQKIAETVFSRTRDLLKSLFRGFIQREYQICSKDLVFVATSCNGWCTHTIELINSAYEKCVVPQDLRYIRCEDGEIAFVANTKNLLFFRYEMSEYCFQLFQTFIMKFPNHPYSAIYNTIPFSYGQYNYLTMKMRIAPKKILTREERAYAEFLPNCGAFQKNLTKQLRHLDKYAGRGETYSKEKETLCDSYTIMADDYLHRLESDGVKDYESLHFAIMIWCWFVRGMVNIALDFEVGILELKKTQDETLEQEDRYSLVRQIREYNSVRALINKRIVSIQSDFFNKYQPGTASHSLPEDTGHGTSVGIVEDGTPERESNEPKEERISYTPENLAIINVEDIHRYTVEKIGSKIDLQSLKDAIEYADFTKLMEDGEKIRVKDYPLVIITKLKSFFKKEWYDDCCSSIGLTATRVSGFHREGTVGKYYYHFPSNLTKAK